MDTKITIVETWATARECYVEWCTRELAADVATAATIEEGRMLALERRGIALIGLKLEESGCGLDLALEILQMAPEMRVVISSGFWRPYVVVEAMRVGIHGYHCRRHDGKTQLLHTLRVVEAGGHYLSAPLAGMAIGVMRGITGPLTPLNEREERILIGLHRREPLRAMASELNMSDSTVGRDVTAIAKKLGCAPDIGAVVKHATETGLLNLASRNRRDVISDEPK